MSAGHVRDQSILLPAGPHILLCAFVLSSALCRRTAGLARVLALCSSAPANDVHPPCSMAVMTLWYSPAPLRSPSMYLRVQMAVPTKEQKLSWEFMRALESASRKGRVVLVIDGVTQLESHMFARLKWLPLHFPTNVRVVLSATVSSTELALATGTYVRVRVRGL